MCENVLIVEQLFRLEIEDIPLNRIGFGLADYLFTAYLLPPLSFLQLLRFVGVAIFNAISTLVIDKRVKQPWI
jgi:hypothetical protein